MIDVRRGTNTGKSVTGVETSPGSPLNCCVTLGTSYLSWHLTFSSGKAEDAAHGVSVNSG